MFPLWWSPAGWSSCCHNLHRDFSPADLRQVIDVMQLPVLVIVNTGWWALLVVMISAMIDRMIDSGIAGNGSRGCSGRQRLIQQVARIDAGRIRDPDASRPPTG
jgi:hypothetical protein